METISKEDSRVNKMIKLENIFREDPGLFAAYTDWEFEKKLYDAALNHVAVSNRTEDIEICVDFKNFIINLLYINN